MTDKFSERVPTHMIDSMDDFADTIAKMNQEGNGRLAVRLFTPQDTARMVLLAMFTRNPQNRCYAYECDQFLGALAENKPICSSGECQNELTHHADVGAIAITHGHCEHPVRMIVAGICESCWSGPIENDRQKGIDAFMSYLRKIMPDIQRYAPSEIESTFGPMDFSGPTPGTRLN